MADPGIYLVNSTGEMSALATESGDGDRELLHEALDELGVTHPRKPFQCDVCDHRTQTDQPTCPQCGIGQMQEAEGDSQ